MLPIAAALLGGVGGYMGAKAKNKKLKGLSAPLPTYSGYRPPHTSYLRPVEKMITDTVMRRSQGQDVGYDPARRNALLENFNIEQDRDLEQTTADLKNRLSGMGLSRNAAAYDELIGRALREAGREKNLYTNRVDIEDLARRNEERDTNTGRLQNLNTFNFGQENKVADFDKDIFGMESGNELSRRGLQAKEAEMYEDPYASALEGAANFGMGTAALGMGGSATPDPYADALIKTGPGMGFRKDLQNRYIAPNQRYNFGRG